MDIVFLAVFTPPPGKGYFNKMEKAGRQNERCVVFSDISHYICHKHYKHYRPTPPPLQNQKKKILTSRCFTGFYHWAIKNTWKLHTTKSN